ncbi:MAG TPA: V-type ATP synthase subunit D [Synergistales bacterium]|nr:V-type ATP synthase subunit D [Synergistales bacterium]
MATKVTPTRENLLDIKRRTETVKYGKQLLEKKRDALLRSLEEDRRKLRDMERQFRELCKNIGMVYSLVRMYEGQSILQLLKPGRPILHVKVFQRTLMGCRFSQFEPVQDERSTGIFAAFDPAMTSLYVDDLLRALSETDRILWPYINLKTKITALENELKRTLLKINTLEYTVLPDLNDQRKLIEEVLGERERQERFSVKKIKRKKEIRIRYGQQDPV